MAKTVAIGVQDFGELIKNNYFYVDKTDFIREWWENGDSVTLITRPRRFGKTLNMSMLEHFFSERYAGEASLFENLRIWQYPSYRALQGTYPVISLSFARIKPSSYQSAVIQFSKLFASLYREYRFLLDDGLLAEDEAAQFKQVLEGDSIRYLSEDDMMMVLYNLSFYLERLSGKKVLIFLDEYDTPMQEAYVNGFWNEIVSFTRSLFNNTFKTNPYMERAIMTGITRVSKESIFSDLNNLKVITTTSGAYATAFGFTEEEVFAAMDDYGMTQKAEVKHWYDGFVFGHVRDIYNPWSIINFLDTGELRTYWANTSANSLVGKLLQEGNRDIKEQFETLLRGESIRCILDEQIVYNQLDDNENAIWSLLLASGYLKVVQADVTEELYELTLTNYEVERMFKNMVSGWFKGTGGNYNDFVKALLQGNRKAMNTYMNRVALCTFSYFDTGRQPSYSEPERFYHGFVLGLLVELSGRYVLTSNRESGFGRYDVLLEPLRDEDDGIIMEFKVHDEEDEKTLEDTVAAALAQIDEKQYEQVLTDHGISKEHIRKYGFAFEGKTVLIG
jgi:hypothetical protein